LVERAGGAPWCLAVRLVRVPPTRSRRVLLRPDVDVRPDPVQWQGSYARVVRAMAPHAHRVVMDALSDVPERMTGELFACRDALFARSRGGHFLQPYMAMELDARDPETVELVAQFAAWSRSLDMVGRGGTSQCGSAPGSRG
jgi:hypothetical protein